MHISNVVRQSYHDKKVLVTGGAGFIGSHVVDALVACNAHVTVLDDLSTGNLQNLEPIRSAITFVQASILDTAVLQELCDQHEIIFHLAARTSVPQCEQYPLECHAINVTGTAHVLYAAQQAHCNRLVFSSSAAVYGRTQEVCSETLLSQPCSQYGLSKLMGEQLCEYYRNNTQLQTVCLRYFNVYGDRQNGAAPTAGVIAIMKHALEHNVPLTLYGDGLQTRDFVSVHDVVLANLLAGMHPQPESVINVASGKSVSLIEMFKQLKQTYPYYTHPVQFKPARLGDIKHSQADCSRFTTLKSLEF